MESASISNKRTISWSNFQCLVMSSKPKHDEDSDWRWFENSENSDVQQSETRTTRQSKTLFMIWRWWWLPHLTILVITVIPLSLWGSNWPPITIGWWSAVPNDHQNNTRFPDHRILYGRHLFLSFSSSWHQSHQFQTDSKVWSDLGHCPVSGIW